jgi:hypothetical protein
MGKAPNYKRRRVAGLELLELERDPIWVNGTGKGPVVLAEQTLFGVQLSHLPLGIAFEGAGPGWGVFDVFEFHDPAAADRFFAGQAAQLITPSTEGADLPPLPDVA